MTLGAKLNTVSKQNVSKESFQDMKDKVYLYLATLLIAQLVNVAVKLPICLLCYFTEVSANLRVFVIVFFISVSLIILGCCFSELFFHAKLIMDLCLVLYFFHCLLFGFVSELLANSKLEVFKGVLVAAHLLSCLVVDGLHIHFIREFKEYYRNLEEIVERDSEASVSYTFEKRKRKRPISQRRLVRNAPSTDNGYDGLLFFPRSSRRSLSSGISESSLELEKRE